MKKAILISSVPPPMGGIAKWTQRYLGEHLPDNWVLDLVDDKMLGKRESFGDEIKYNYFNEAKRWFRVWKTLNGKIRQKEALVAHACPIATVPSMLVNIISASIVKLAGKKHIIHFRCTVPNLINTSLQKKLLQILCNKSDLVICLNNQTKLFLESVTKTKIALLPNFVDASEIQEHEIRPFIKNVVYVGGVTKEKGCDNLVSVAKECPDIIFNCVGKSSSEIAALAYDVPNVVLHGVKNGAELKKVLDNADIFIFLSRFWGEGFSNAIAEAMASGLPCIVTDWAANADQVEDGKGGFVVRDHIVEDTVIALKKLNDPGMRKRFSLYNRNKVVEQYSANRIIREYIACYNQITSYDN